MSRTLSDPCIDCPASEECWNYGKEPDPENPTGPFRIVSWFHCHLPDSPSNARIEMRTIDKVITREMVEAALFEKADP
jgi:hypothetical protein